VFVFQRKDGIWDVIDGVQRLSTIFQFIGVLKDSTGTVLPPLILQKTRYLPSLLGKSWERSGVPSDDPEIISSDQRIAFRRSKIDIKIVKSESSDQSKYDLFQRLNTGGTPATEQEIRNCILIMQNKRMYEWLSQLSENVAFRETLSLSERMLEERYDVELALRFVLLKTMPEENLRKIKELDLAAFVTDNMISAAEADNLDYELETHIFNKTFSMLHASLEDNAFKKYDPNKVRFVGGFSVSGFEAVAFGLGFQFTRNINWSPTYNLETKVKALWSESQFTNNMGSGISSSSRIPKIVPFARTFFN